MQLFGLLEFVSFFFVPFADYSYWSCKIRRADSSRNEYSSLLSSKYLEDQGDEYSCLDECAHVHYLSGTHTHENLEDSQDE